METYNRADLVKIAFDEEVTGIGEWMWLRVDHCDDEKQLGYGTLDNEPLNDYDGKVGLGSVLAASFSQIREHRKPTELDLPPEPYVTRPEALSNPQSGRRLQPDCRKRDRVHRLVPHVVQRLSRGVHAVVVRCRWESSQLVDIVVQPGR